MPLDNIDLAMLVSRVDAKVDILLARMDSDGKRLSAVEKKVWWAAGAVAIAAALVAPQLRHVVGV